MPIGFLTTAERDRLNRFPVPIPDDDLFAFFQLSEADHTVINQQREDHTRLGFAPDDLQTAPREAIVYVARQLGIPPEAFAAYGRRIPTRTTHL
jgi:TnpA family transposase